MNAVATLTIRQKTTLLCLLHQASSQKDTRTDASGSSRALSSGWEVGGRPVAPNALRRVFRRSHQVGFAFTFAFNLTYASLKPSTPASFSSFSLRYIPASKKACLPAYIPSPSRKQTSSNNAGTLRATRFTSTPVARR